ncbi:MAG: U32 family peptidase [Clostridia bacterium]|nr:U32 family peptidase [Clostridia bacterium]
MKKKVELLAPAGDLVRLKTAVLYGADAVYIGGEEFSMRTACDNFTHEQIKTGVDFAKKHGRKVYVAANVIMRERDMEKIAGFAKDMQALGVDALIVSDLGAFGIIQEAAPALELHISTQANITNWASAMAWYKMGASRVVLARELSRQEIQCIREKTPADLELEMFVHGAMCVSYSGRCLLSNYMAERDANRGDCAQACRWKYALVEEKRPGEYMPIIENERGSFIFNSKDLCLIEYLPEIIASGVYSLKIEGRVKSEYYVATVVKAYREAIDRYLENPDQYTTDPAVLEALCKVSHRQYCHGFWEKENCRAGQIYDKSSYIRTYQVVGMTEGTGENGMTLVSQRNKFSVGEEIEIMQPNGADFTHTITEMYAEDGTAISEAPHPMHRIQIPMGRDVAPYSFVRKKVGEGG